MMRNRFVGVCLTFAGFAALAGCAAAEVAPGTVAVADTVVAPALDRGERPYVAAVPDETPVPVPEAMHVPEPTMVDMSGVVDTAPAAEGESTVDAVVTVGEVTSEEDASVPEYVSPEESDLPPVDETATMDCVDWAQADGLAYEDAAALCDGLSSEGYPTSDLTHEEYEWNFTDQATRQGL
jgi:hypothetical protein